MPPKKIKEYSSFCASFSHDATKNKTLVFIGKFLPDTERSVPEVYNHFQFFYL